MGYQSNYYPNPYMNYGQGYTQNYSQGYNQLPTNTQNYNTIQCQYVDGIDVVRAINTDMNGKPMFFVKTDGTEIYRKQLNPNTGLSDLHIYTLGNNEEVIPKPENTIDLSIINTQLNDFKQDILNIINGFSNDISEIKDLVLDSITSPSKGGDK